MELLAEATADLQVLCRAGSGGMQKGYRCCAAVVMGPGVLCATTPEAQAIL